MFCGGDYQLKVCDDEPMFLKSSVRPSVSGTTACKVGSEVILVVIYFHTYGAAAINMMQSNGKACAY